MSPATAAAPAHGAVRFSRTFKEQPLWIERIDAVEALRLALVAFKDRYNHERLIEHRGHQAPSTIRAALFATDAAA